MVLATAADGSVVVELPGGLRYAARPGFTGTDTVTYLIAGVQAGQAQGLVLVDVTVRPVTGCGRSTLLLRTRGRHGLDPGPCQRCRSRGRRATQPQASAEGGPRSVIEPGGTLTYTAPGSFSGIHTVSHTTVTYTASHLVQKRRRGPGHDRGPAARHRHHLLRCHRGRPARRGRGRARPHGDGVPRLPWRVGRIPEKSAQKCRRRSRAPRSPVAR